MSLGDLLEIVVGLFVVYLVLSILCSTLNELIANELGRRGRFLREGLINVVRDRWVYLRVINHPLLASLYRDLPGKARAPSYVPPGNFAQALLDVVVLKASQLDASFPQAGAPRTIDDVRRAVHTCKDAGYTIGDALVPLVENAEGSLEGARRNIEGWYESAMERVSGWYKRHARRTLFGIGLVAAITCNVDTLAIVRDLAKDSALRTSLAELGAELAASKEVAGSATGTAEAEQLRELIDDMGRLEARGLPVGFSCLGEADLASASGWGAVLSRCWAATVAERTGSWALRLVGWLLTALAVSFGAPFWFELLNKVVSFRGAGPKPDAPVTQPR